MIEGVLRHDTEMDVEKQYVDTHGQSEVGFAFCHLLGFALLPRLKNLKKQRLYRPSNGEQYTNLQAILTRPINWEIIEQQYDELIKLTRRCGLGQLTPNRSCGALLSITRSIQPTRRCASWAKL